MPSPQASRAPSGALWALSFLLLFFLVRTHAQASPFSDLPATHWANQAIESMAAKGFMTGYSHEVFGGQHPATRYETAMVLARLVVFLEKEKPYVPLSFLEKLKETLADYQDEIERSGLKLQNLEKQIAALESRINEIERIHVKGEFHNRTMATQITGNLGSGNGQDTTFADANLNRPYPLFPVHAGQNTTSLGLLELSAQVDDQWQAGGRLTGYNSTGDPLNGLVFGKTPSFFNNPFEGYPTNNNLKLELDQVFAQTKDDTLHGELGTFYPEHSPPYLYSGVPNLSLEGPDFLPNYGGRFLATMKPYFFVSTAFSEIFAGKLAQASPWQTQLYGANFGIGLFGITLNAHWMTAQNDPANFAAGTSGMVTTPINGGGGWLNPLTLNPLAVGPQKEKAWGVDMSITRNVTEHSLTFRAAYGNSDYKPNTNSSNNAKGELYDLSAEAEVLKNTSIGLQYISVDPKYSPFILPLALPSGITLAAFPWGQWPFPVDFQGYYTLQNAQHYPQNRQGIKAHVKVSTPADQLSAGIRWLSQKVATQLSLFNNDTDIQSIGFFEPLFTASGSKPRAFPAGTTMDWNVFFQHQIQPPLSLELTVSGVQAKRFAADANNIDFTGWLGHAGLVYEFWEKWKLHAAYHLASVNGRLLAAAADPPNNQFHNNGETVRIDVALTPKANAFFIFRNLDHFQIQGGSNFHLLQFLTGFDLLF